MPERLFGKLHVEAIRLMHCRSMVILQEFNMRRLLRISVRGDSLTRAQQRDQLDRVRATTKKFDI